MYPTTDTDYCQREHHNPVYPFIRTCFAFYSAAESGVAGRSKLETEKKGSRFRLPLIIFGAGYSAHGFCEHMARKVGMFISCRRPCPFVSS